MFFATPFFLPFLLISTHLVLGAAPPKKELAVLDPSTPIHLHSYANPSTSSNCNLDCRRIFCNSVSQFLESVTCTSHRPCLSLNLQFKIQEKCLNWRPETHHGSGVASVGKPASTQDVADPDCADAPLPPSAPQWVKAYVPADIGYEWLRKGGDSHTHPMPGLEYKAGAGIMCIGVVRWMGIVGVAMVLFCLWQVRDRKQKLAADRWVKGKEEM